MHGRRIGERINGPLAEVQQLVLQQDDGLSLAIA